MADRPHLLRRAVAEGVGTFALVPAGCGAIVTNAERHGAVAAGRLLLAVWPGHPANLGATVPSIAVGRALLLLTYQYLRGEQPQSPLHHEETPIADTDGDRSVRLPA